jgi:anti-sigma-K factor RskA
MRRFPPAAAHALAAEYVLGTLRGRARQRFEALARSQPGLAETLRRWEDALTPLAERVTPLAPPSRVWRSIEARLAPRASGAADSFWSNVAFWRGLGLVAGGFAAVLLAAFLWLAPAERDGEPLFVAVLTAPDSAARMVVSMHAPDILRVRTVKSWGGIEGKGLELWALPQGGAPRSLGMVRNEGDTRIRIATNDPRVQSAAALAVSLEPPGGSPTGKPTGPVLCSGAIAPVRKT